MSGGRERVVAVLLERHGRTYADEAGIRLRDTPAPLHQLLVLSLLLSARIRASVAVAASRALRAAGWTSARAMASASWADRARVLLKRLEGIGDVGVDIFFREAQAVWPTLRPFVDDRTRAAARRLGLPHSAAAPAAKVCAS